MTDSLEARALAVMKERIVERGFVVVVIADRLRTTFTLGLTEAGLPELALFGESGLAEDDRIGLLGGLAMLSLGDELQSGNRYTVDRWLVEVRPLSQRQTRLCLDLASAMYDSRLLPALQLFLVEEVPEHSDQKLEAVA